MDGLTMADLFATEPTSQDLALEGMANAIEHADRVSARWSAQAGQLLRIFSQIKPEFMAEDMRVWAHREGLPLPPDPRAWGAVVHRAVREGVIVCDRFEMTKIKPAHATPRPVWRSTIYQAAA
jgi:hypothetical protein